MTDFSRRDLLKIGAGAAVGAAAGGIVRPSVAADLALTPEPGASLRVLRWSQFVQGDIDLWMANTTDPAVRDCEAALTPNDPDTIIVNPPTDLPVDPRPLYADGRCWPNTVAD